MLFRFAYPPLLALLAGVAVWAAVVLYRRPPALTFSLAAELGRLAGGRGLLRRRLPLLLRGGALVLVVLAAARPQLYNVSREVRTPGVDIVLCLDTSGSMQALDFTIDGEPVTRLEAVKKVVGDFIEKREGDRIGLVVFGAEAFTQSPLTLDRGLLLELVKRLEIGMAGDRTAIGSALAVGGKRLKEIEAKSRILILVTDGRHNAGALTPAEAAEALTALGIKVYTIGVGGEGPAPFRVETVFGPRIVQQEVDLDEETLQEVARIGGGRYFRASDSRRLEEIYDIIDRAEKREVKVKEFFHYRELYLPLLAGALLLLGLEIAGGALIGRALP